MYKLYICIFSIHTLLHHFIYHTYMVMFIRTYVSSPPLPLSLLISLSLFFGGKIERGREESYFSFSLSLIIYLSSPSLPPSLPLTSPSLSLPLPLLSIYIYTNSFIFPHLSFYVCIIPMFLFIYIHINMSSHLLIYILHSPSYTHVNISFIYRCYFIQ